MSVINQMLKDLDKRTGENNEQNVMHVPVIQKNESKTLLFVVIIVTIALTLSAGYMWLLQSENDQLKKQANVTKNEKLVVSVADRQLTAKNEATPQLPKNSPLNDSNIVNKSAPDNKTLSSNEDKPKVEKQTTAKAEEVIKEELTVGKPTRSAEDNNSTSKMTAVNKLETKNKTQPIVEQDVTDSKVMPKPSLSISRKQLTPEELAAQKMEKAQEALFDKDIALAEKLFEETLLLTPENKQARKQLAALWYGRQAYQDALNVLSRGLSNDPNDSEFRLMQARIYLAQNQNKAALNVLLVLSETSNVEYQSLLANTAQAINELEHATRAYEKLIAMQPQQARWFLGYGVVLDRQSLFDDAIIAYNQALSLGNLSDSAMQFASSRLQELGE